MIKAVALDIDGTLTDESRRIHLGAVAAIRELEERGVPVLIATGNILCITEAVAIMTGASGPVIAENGGIIKDRESGQVQFLGDITEPRRAYDFLKTRFQLKKLAHSELRRTEVAVFRTEPVEDLRTALEGFAVELVDTNYAIHIKKTGVNKGMALERVARLMGLETKDFAAVGDSEGDREMLEVAGYGVSVGDDCLGDVSDLTTEKKYGDGGEEAIKTIISLL